MRAGYAGEDCPKVDFPTAIGMVVERDDGSTLMEIDGDKGKQGGPTYYIDTNALRVPRENMEAISPLKMGWLKTGIVSRLFWIIPTKCMSNQKPASILFSCQRHRGILEQRERN